MPGESKIEWTEATWNPTTGCTKVSPGCAHCYAETLTARYAGSPGWPAEFKPWIPGNDTVVLHPDRLDAPLKWRTPRRVFVDSMSDLFHEDVPFEYIDRVFAVMALTPQHTYQVLTKRPERMREYMTSGHSGTPYPPVTTRVAHAMESIQVGAGPAPAEQRAHWPLPNVWLGVTVENQRWADIRIPILLDTPAAVRFISAEPLLGPLDLRSYLGLFCSGCGSRGDSIRWANVAGGYIDGHVTGGSSPDVCGPAFRDPAFAAIDWLIIGGESGSKHRPFDQAWARSLIEQARIGDCKPFVKQLGGARPGNKLEDLPPDLRVREYPR